MEFIVSMFTLALKLLSIGAGFWIFMYVLRHGKGTFKELVETVCAAIQYGCSKLRKYLINKLRKENGLEGPGTTDKEAVMTEGSVQ